MAKKVAPPIERENIDDVNLDKEFSTLARANIQEEAEKVLSEIQLDILKRIAYYVGRVGLDVREACILLGVDPDKFVEEMKMTPIIQKVIEVKELEYKKDLMATLSSKARAGDDKLALALLEYKDPDKFGKKKNPGDGALDPMREAIEYVQNTTHNPLVKESSGHATHAKTNEVKRKRIDTAELLKRINKIGNEPYSTTTGP